METEEESRQIQAKGHPKFRCELLLAGTFVPYSSDHGSAEAAPVAREEPGQLKRMPAHPAIREHRDVSSPKT